MAYNTEPFHGKLARIEKNDVKMEFTEGWNIDMSLELADAMRQGKHWKEHVAGYGEWGGSFSGQLVAGNTQQKAIIDNIVTAVPGVKLTDMKFLLDAATNAITGNIFITGLSIAANKDGIVVFTCNFKGDDAPSLTSTA